MKNPRPTGPSGLRGRVNQPRNIPRWWTQTAAQAREYNFMGPRDFRPPSQRTPGRNNYNFGGPPPARIEHSIPRSGQLLGPGLTPKGKSIVPQIARRRPVALRPQTSTEWGDNYRRVQAAAKLARRLARLNPYLNAMDIGFQLLDSWTAYGPQQEEIPEVPEHWNDGVWNVRAECDPDGREYIYDEPLAANLDACLGNQARTRRWGSFEEALQQNPNRLGVGIWRRNFATALFRYTHVRTWTRPSTSSPTHPTPYLVPYQPAQPGKRTVQRAPTSVVPAPAVSSNYDTPPRSTHRPDVIIGTLKPLNPTRPSEVPANTVEVLPGGIRKPPQKPHVLAPPRPGGKELKLQVQKGSPLYKAISDLYNGATEADDFIQIVADSIPGNTCKGLRPVEASLCIGRNLDKIDIDKMIEGLIYNHVEDQLVGAFLSWGKKAPYGTQLPTNAFRLRQQLKGKPRVFRP